MKKILNILIYFFPMIFSCTVAENVPVKLTLVNKDSLTMVVMPRLKIKKFPKSTSRLVVFIYSVMAISIAQVRSISTAVLLGLAQGQRDPRAPAASALLLPQRRGHAPP